MPTYVSQQGRVLVIQYPVPPRTAGSGPLPPIEIAPAPPQNATGDIAYVVYEPYEAKRHEPMPTQRTPRAYGPHRRPTPKEQAQEKAQHVARSIVAHGWTLAEIPWSKYGPRLAASAAARQAVLAAVARLREEGGKDGMD